MSIRVDIPRLVVRLFVAPVCLAAALVATSAAEILVVTTTSDSINAGDGCSLREALINANTDSKQGSIECSAGSGADVIILPPQLINLTSSVAEESDTAVGDLDIASDITIWGGGQQVSRLSMSAFSRGRIFDVLPGASLTLRGVQLEKGFAAQEGGSIRVASGAVLNLVDAGIVASTIDPISVGGRGGAIYLADDSTTTIARSAIVASESMGLLGEGGGIYCDSCELSMETTTFTRNQATASGGGLYVAGGSNVSLDYVTFGFNTSVTGSAIHSLGNLTLHAALNSDNGAGLPGDDLQCSAGTFAATYSFIEFPAGCAPLTGVQTRADLPPNAQNEALLGMQNARFDDQPSTILQWRIELPTVPAAACAGHRDQHYRRVADQENCDVGAFQRPKLTVNPMRFWNQVTTNGPLFAISIGMHGVFPDRPTRVVLSVVGGIGEDCDFPDLNFDYNGISDYAISQLVDPDAFFPAPALGRVDRICELEGRVVSGDPTLIGMTTGVLRVMFHDTSIASASLVSVPASGNYLIFGTVPVGAGGTSNVYFRPTLSSWNVTGVTFTGPDAVRFGVGSAITFPLAIDNNGVLLPFRCLGGTIGDYDAVAEVATDNPSFPVLIYGLRCRVAHLLSLTANTNWFREGSTLPFFLTAQLDSPSVLADPLTFDLLNVPGTAFASSDDDRVNMAIPALRPDYQAFAGPLTINPGEQGVTVPISVIDDLVFLEGSETFGARLVLATRNDVELSPSNSVSLRIDDNDEPERGLSAYIAGVPSILVPGSQLDVQITARNSSDVDKVRNFDIGFSVDNPIRIIGFVVTQVTITCDAHRGWLIRTIVDPVAEAAALAAFEADCPVATGGLITSSDASNQAFALALMRGAFCSIGSRQQSAHCTLNDDAPEGTLVTIRAVIEMARMVEPPKLDYPGEVTVRARGAIGSTNVEVTESAEYVIKGNASGSGGGFGWPALLIAGLLAFRGRRKWSTGREAG